MDLSRELAPRADIALELHSPTLELCLRIMRRSMDEGQRMGLKVGTLREAIEDIERLYASAKPSPT